MAGRRAVVLFNLGGPDDLKSVEPFLFNLFRDPAILSLPNPFRWLLAKSISRKRAGVAQGIYAQIGGGSPLLKETREQAAALEALLNDGADTLSRVFVCMRYWHPMSAETARDVARFKPDEIILLPLYPQFSTTTSESSLKDWMRAAAAEGLTVPQRAVCCFPAAAGLVEAQAELVAAGIAAARETGTPRVLFSAHGLPKKVIAGGDPYQWQVEQTAAAVVARLAARGHAGLDWVVCYQSRVGPLEWIGPATEDEIKRGGKDKVPLVVVPIAFVSEHSETLVELDIEYAHVATEAGVPAYHRVPTVGIHPAFVAALAGLVRDVAASGIGCGRVEGRICPADRTRCINGKALAP